MHKAAPDVNWRQIEAANAKQKWMNLSGSIVRTATSETFANSYILGTWVEKGTYNQTGRLLNVIMTKPMTSSTLYQVAIVFGERQEQVMDGNS